MIRFLSASLMICLPAGAISQVRQGGVYQITAENLDSGGGSSNGGSYGMRQALPALGAPASGGVYTILSGFVGQLGSGGGTGSGPAAFLSWQTALFGGPAERGAGTYDDTDGDGIPNLLEFAFNLSPFAASTAPAELGTTGGVPLIREEIFGTERYITMEFIRRKNAGLSFPETSAQLSNWIPAGFTVLSGPDSVTPVYERMKLRLGSPIQTGMPVFYRLAVIVQ